MYAWGEGRVNFFKSTLNFIFALLQSQEHQGGSPSRLCSAVMRSGGSEQPRYKVRCYEISLLRDIEDFDRRREPDEKNRPLVIEALTSRMRAARCAARRCTCTLAHSRAAKPFRNCDAWPSAVAAAFYLRTRSSSFPTKSAKAANERRRPARMHHTSRRGRGGDHLSRGCIHRACLTRVYPERESNARGQCGARPRDECSRMFDPAVRLRTPAKHMRAHTLHARF